MKQKTNPLTKKQKAKIDKGVDKTIKDFGDTLKMMGGEEPKVAEKWEDEFYDKFKLIRTEVLYEMEQFIAKQVAQAREDVVAEYNNYLLARFNDYDVPLRMTANKVRNLLNEFLNEYDTKK